MLAAMSATTEPHSEAAGAPAALLEGVAVDGKTVRGAKA